MQSSNPLGNYELLEILGRGSFATVWKASHRQLHRLSAVKVFDGLARKSPNWPRFLREARIAARLRHPNIVRILEIESGENFAAKTPPFLVFELVDGVSLSEWAGFAQLSYREIAEIGAKLASALHYAHQRGVVHRDVKPDNILVDLSGEPKITDFGLARQIDDRMTEHGVTLGTIAYMSPEQARGDSGQADARSDVYALGVILYELLSGQLPFTATSIPGYLAQVSGATSTSPKTINPGIPKDLETICLKCLENAPQSRYATAGALEKDLKRFIEGRPIQARPAGIAEQFRRWCLRQPLAAALVAVLVVIAFIGPLIAWRQYAIREALAVRTEALASTNYSANLAAAYRAWNEGYLKQARTHLDRAAAQEGEKDPRDFAWRFLDQRLNAAYRVVAESKTPIFDGVLTKDGARLLTVGAGNKISVWDVSKSELIKTIPLPGERYYAIATFPDENTVVVGDQLDGKRQLRAFDMRTGLAKRTIELASTRGEIDAMRVSPRRDFLIVGSRDDRWQIFDSRWRPVAIPPNQARHVDAAFSPDASVVALCVNDQARGFQGIRFQSLESGVGRLLKETGLSYSPNGVAWAPDGSFLAVYAGGSKVDLFRWPELENYYANPMPDSMKTKMVFYPDGRSLAGGCDDGSVFVENVAINQDIHRPLISDYPLDASVQYYPHDASVRSLFYLRGGRLLSCSEDGAIASTRPSAFAQAGAHTLMSSNLVYVMGYSNRLDQVLVGDIDGRLLSDDGAELNRLGSCIRSISFSPDGRQVACSLENGVIVVLNTSDYSIEKVLETVQDEAEPSRCFAFSEDNKFGFSGGEDNVVRMWRLEDGEAVFTDELPGNTRCVAVQDQMGLVLFGGGHEDILAYDIPRRRRVFRFSVDDTNGLLVHPNLPLLISAHDDGVIRIWNLKTRKFDALLRGHKSGVRCLALNRDGKTLASGGWDGTVRLWDLRRREQIGIAYRAKPRFSISQLTFMADGQSLAARVKRGGSAFSRIVRIGSTKPEFHGYTVQPEEITHNPGHVRLWLRNYGDPEPTFLNARVYPNQKGEVSVSLDERCKGYEVRAHFKVDIIRGEAMAYIKQFGAQALPDEEHRFSARLGKSKKYSGGIHVLTTDWVRITHGDWRPYFTEESDEINPYAAVLWFAGGPGNKGVDIYGVKIEVRECRD